MKNTNTITKKIAAILAAAMMMTTAASIAASADNTDTANTTIAAQNAKELEKARDLGIDMIIMGIDEFVPGGNVVTFNTQTNTQTNVQITNTLHTQYNGFIM